MENQSLAEGQMGLYRMVQLEIMGARHAMRKEQMTYVKPQRAHRRMMVSPAQLNQNCPAEVFGLVQIVLASQHSLVQDLRVRTGDSLDVTFQERLTGFGANQLPELVQLIETRHSQFSPVSLCTALHRLATFPAGNKQYQRCLGLLSTLESQVRERPDRFRAQSVANACWAVAKLQWNANSLLQALIEMAQKRVDDFKPQELSLFLWGIASSGGVSKAYEAAAAATMTSEFLRRGSGRFDAQSTATLAYAAGILLVTSEPFWSALDVGSANRVLEFSDRQLANLVWGFATVVYTDCTTVFTRVAKEAPIAKLAPIDLSLVAWSMAKVSQGGQDFYDQVADAVCAKRSDWKMSDPRNIATLLYSFALAEQATCHDGAFRELAEAVCKRTREFSVQGLTNAVWAYATACYTDEHWFNVVAREVLSRDHAEFEPLDVSNCLWAYAAVLHKDSSMISRLTSLGKVMIAELSAQNLAISVWALASLEVRDHQFFERAADPFVARLAECKTQELNNMLWAYATACVRLPWLFIKVCNHARAVGLEEFKMHELSIMMWAHGTAGVCNHDFFDDVVGEVLENRGIESCAPREVANAAWAYSTIIGRCHWPWMEAVAGFSESHICEFDMQGIGNVLWSFANVVTYSKALLEVACSETAKRVRQDPQSASHNVAQVLSAAQAAGALHVELLEAAVDAFLGHDFALEASKSSMQSITARELLILGNAARPASDRLGGRWKRLMDYLDFHIFHPLRRAVPSISEGHDNWSSMEDCISELDLDHLGVGFTAQFLADINAVSSTEIFGGSESSGSDWIKEAAAACAIERERAIRAGQAEAAPLNQQKLVRQLDKVNKREIVAWVRVHAAGKTEPGRAFSWQLEAETSKESSSASRLLKPLMTRSRVAPNLVGEHDRSGHAERCALMQVTADLLDGTSPNNGWRIKGELFLYVTHYPCISCVCVIAQFSRLFPQLAIHLAYADGRSHAQSLVSFFLRQFTQNTCRPMSLRHDLSVHWADKPEYWNRVYNVQGQHGRSLFEWYGLGYQQLRSSVLELLAATPSAPSESRLLVLGSGDSALSAELASDEALQKKSWQVTSIDFSAEVTERMRQRFPGLTFLTMDARNMSDFDDGHFAAAVDKGLSDCLGTVTARQEYFQEVRRVLRSGGQLLVVSQRRLWAGQDSVSDGLEAEDAADLREPHLEAHDLGPGWSCKEKEMYGPLFMESDPKQPPFPQPGTEGTIPYFVLTCHVLADAMRESEI
ncbi:eef1aknmt [Symbiodinium pilosum]|uniref:Eef1aknmt protein n=1 Tax=Symbiodinium pilosum TaxID=2952 RepID=A0A812Y5H0_SYMPI|nr:eef1aknmt [Symbiodinium pilosum]